MPPLGEQAQRALENTILNFTRFCVHEGVVVDINAVRHLPIEELRDAAERWLAWRVTDIGPTHALLGRGRGMRASRLGYRKPDVLRTALNRWALLNALDPVVTARAYLMSSVSRPTVASAILTDEQLAAVVLALVAEGVVEAVNPAVTEAWHARQLAAIALSIAGSLRPTDELPMLREENILSLTDDVMRVQFPRTKHVPEGRLVTFHANPTMLCPLWALARFLDCCERNGWQRGGYLVPPVSLRRRAPLMVGSQGNVLGESLGQILQHLGFEFNDSTGAKVTPHGMRAMNPSRAFELGLDLRHVQKFTDHKSISALVRYDRSQGVGPQIPSALGSGATSEMS